MMISCQQESHSKMRLTLPSNEGCSLLQMKTNQGWFSSDNKEIQEDGTLVQLVNLTVRTGLKIFILINALICVFNFHEKHPQMKKKLH